MHRQLKGDGSDGNSVLNKFLKYGAVFSMGALAVIRMYIGFVIDRRRGL